MENRRQPDELAGPAEPPAYWVDGAAVAAGTDLPEREWDSAGAETESIEPLALASDIRSGARPRHQAPSFDDDTPAAGTPTLEPPLWRQASRFTPGSRTYGAPTEYVSTYAVRGDGHPERVDGEPLGRQDEPHDSGAGEETYGGRYDGEPYGDGADEPTYGARRDNDTYLPSDRADTAPSAPAFASPDGLDTPVSGPGDAPSRARRASAPPGYTPERSGDPSPLETPDSRPSSGAPASELATLPQRVPAEPDVPTASASSPEPDNDQRERWTAPELAWIADQLRRDDVPGDTFSEPLDVDAVLTAVREVAGVRAASVRTGPDGTHTLRLDLADQADAGEVSRVVARLLLERMGLSAAPSDSNTALDSPDELGQTPAWTPPAPRVPMDTPVPAESATTSSGLADPVASGPIPADPLSVGPPPADTTPTSREPTVPPPPPGLSPEPAQPVEETPPEPIPRPLPITQPGPRVVIDQVQVRSQGLEAQVEVHLSAGDRQAVGTANGPAVDSYLVRLAAIAAADGIDELLRDAEDDTSGEPSRCFVEHTTVISFGGTEVAVVVVLLVCGSWVERLTGSALVDGDPRQAVVRATLGAVNRRLEALLD